MLAKTTKATKVSRGSEQQRKPEDAAEQQLNVECMEDDEEKKGKESEVEEEGDEDDDDEEGTVDIPMDTDGNRKKAMTEYEGDSQSEAGSC